MVKIIYFLFFEKQSYKINLPKFLFLKFTVHPILIF